jgi:hypothetical protein
MLTAAAQQFQECLHQGVCCCALQCCQVSDTYEGLL